MPDPVDALLLDVRHFLEDRDIFGDDPRVSAMINKVSDAMREHQKLRDDVDRIKRVLTEAETLHDLSQRHTCFEATEDYGGVADEDITHETLQVAAELEWVMNWLHPNYISPAFPPDWIAENRPDLLAQ